MSNLISAPILIFAYNREDKINNLISSLTKCEGFNSSKIFVFCDGPKNKQDKTKVEKTRKIIRNRFISNENVTYFEQTNNLGLAKSIYNGINYVFSFFDRVIVLEDDLEINKGFLRYMNLALTKYQNSDEVFQISGHFFEPPELKTNKALFLPFITTWGWATWKSKWVGFDIKKEILLDSWDKNLKNKFNLNNSYNYYYILNGVLKNKIQSWGVLWYFYVFQNKGLVLYPNKSLVVNKGFDKEATNTNKSIYLQIISQDFIEITFPKEVKVDPDINQIVFKYIKLKNKNNFVKWFLKKINFYR